MLNNYNLRAAETKELIKMPNIQNRDGDFISEKSLLKSIAFIFLFFLAVNIITQSLFPLGIQYVTIPFLLMAPLFALRKFFKPYIERD